MRGIGTVIFVGFISIILFGLVAPSLLEPIVDVVIADSAVQDHEALDGQAFSEDLLQSVLVWAPLLVLGSGVVSAVVWYFRQQRTQRRVR